MLTQEDKRDKLSIPACAGQKVGFGALSYRQRGEGPLA